MARRQWVKKELNKDGLASTLSRTIQWAMANRENVMIGGVVILAALIFIPFLISHQMKMDTECMDMVSQGEILSLQNQPDRAISNLDAALAKGRKKAEPFALLYKGNTLYSMGRYRDAIDSYKKYMEKYEKKPLTPEVLMGLACSYEQEGDYNMALSTFRNFINKYPDNPLLGEVYNGTGRCYELSGQKDMAIETYQKISTMYEGKLWGSIAKARIEALTAPPSPAVPEKKKMKP